MSREAVAKFGKVGVLYGGTSSEREVSLNSGGAVIEALTRRGVDVVAIDATEGFIKRLPDLNLDRVVIMLHGQGGEDGTLQGGLQLLGLPYTGSGVMASSLAMDKLRAKQLWTGIGLPTANFALLEETTNWQETLQMLGGKAMVKPVREGSSIGMSIAASAAELEAAWQKASAFDSQVIAEQWLAGGEYTVALVGDRLLPIIKLETDRSFYDYEAKYLVDDTRYLCPCGLDDASQQRLQQLAKQAFDSLGCTGWGRVDVMADEQGEFNLLEVNTVPGMTDHSLVPMAAAAAGISFDQLVLDILETSLERRW